MIDREAIRQTLIGLMEADTGNRYENLQDSAKLREELGLDSVDVVSLVSQVERKFRIRMTQDELMTLTTFGDFMNLLQRKLGNSSAAA
jgi:acyl carrier protein